MSDAVLVTGAAGFVGSAITRRLTTRIESGDLEISDGRTIGRVIAAVRPEQSRFRLAEALSTSVCHVREVDMGSPDAVEALVREEQPCVIVHSALDAAVFTASRSAAEALAEQPLEPLLRGLAEVGGARFVQTGSSWVLPAGHALDEDTPLSPASGYAFAKAHEEAIVPELAGDLGIEWLILRVFNLIGRYERTDRLIPYLVRQLVSGREAHLSSAHNVRDFTDVDVVATAFEAALTAPPEAADGLYHIGTGCGTRIGRVAEIVAHRIGRPDLVRYGARETPDEGMDVQVADVSRARDGLGWSASGETDEWVRSATEWWLGLGPSIHAVAESRRTS